MFVGKYFSWDARFNSIATHDFSSVMHEFLLLYCMNPFPRCVNSLPCNACLSSTMHGSLLLQCLTSFQRCMDLFLLQCMTSFHDAWISSLTMHDFLSTMHEFSLALHDFFCLAMHAFFSAMHDIFRDTWIILSYNARHPLCNAWIPSIATHDIFS